MIGVLAFNAIKTFKVTRINLLEQVCIEKAFMIFWDVDLKYFEWETAGAD